MTDLTITMSDDEEISDVVRMLAERMSTNPEEFTNDFEVAEPSHKYETKRYPKFGDLYRAVTNSIPAVDSPSAIPLRDSARAYWFLSNAELLFLQEAVRKMLRSRFEAAAIEALYRKEEPEQESEQVYRLYQTQVSPGQISPATPKGGMLITNNTATSAGTINPFVYSGSST